MTMIGDRICSHVSAVRRSSPAGAAAALLLSLLAACADDARQRPIAPAAIIRRDGNWQAGTPGAPLGRPLVVEVQSATGAPVQGAAVRWSVTDGGTVTPPSAVTDANGQARAIWTLGAGTPHSALASVAGGLTAKFAALVGDDPPPLDVPIALELTTYDGSGQVVHPDVASVPADWGTGPQQLAITPYPFGDSFYENPSLFVAPDVVHWLAPDGGTNPVVRPDAAGYLSDPDVVYDPAVGELRLYYRAVTDVNRIMLTRSRDGVAWGTPVEVVRGPNHTVISPTVVRRGDGDWWMWSVDGGSAGCSGASTAVDVRRSADGVHWSAPSRVQLDQPGFYPWHLDVEWLPALGEYWALFNGKRAGSCTTPALFLARSTDGVTWTTYASPVLARGTIPEFEDVVYRSTFAYDAGEDVVTLWYSGARFDGTGYVWRAAVERRSRAELLGIAAAPASADARALAPRPGVPPLVDGP